MSFEKYKDVVEEGDQIMIFMPGKLMTFIVEKGQTHQMKFGALKHSELIGVKYGSKFQCSKGFVHILHPTPELWSLALPHRTQILYATDISMITLHLDLKPGSIVVESGHLHTFEFHEQRAQIAAQEFRDHCVSEYVTVTHRDVLQDGFGLDHVADAVFLDLPRPWDAIASGKKALKQDGGRICSFSPCIEQVQQTCSTLQEQCFKDITTMECLLRQFEIWTANLPQPDLGRSQLKNDEDSDNKAHKVHITSDMLTATTSDMLTATTSDMLTATTSNMINKDREQSGSAGQCISKVGDATQKQKRCNKWSPNIDLIGCKTPESYYIKTGVAAGQMPGHTGYLTFATLYPSLKVYNL